MTFYDLLLAAQLMSEERLGKPLRDRERQQYEKERAASKRLLQSVKA